MPNTKISALGIVATPPATATTVIVDGSSNHQVTLPNLVKAAVSGGAAAAGLATVATTGAVGDIVGVGTMASQASSSVTITGGKITGITDLAIADGGTGQSTVAAAVTALGLDYATANTANTLVKRDASGDIFAGTITANSVKSAFIGNVVGNVSGSSNSATSANTATQATNLALGLAGQIPYQTAQNKTAFTAAGTDLQVLISKGTAAPQWVNQTSIASGLADATPNYVWAGPASGSVTGPSSARSLVAADIPTLDQNTTGTAAGLSTPLIATSGGTGQSSYAVGDLLYASTTTALSKLASANVGNVLHSGGAGVAPSYSKVVLTTDVSGTLPVANGGTGATTASTALNALLPSQAGVTSGAVLSTNGKDASWTTGTGIGTITSVKVTNTGVIGLTLGPSDAVTTGAVNLTFGGVLAVSSGGTGSTTQAAALTALGGQTLATTLTQLSSISAATNTLPYFSSASAFSTTPLTAAARTFLTKATQQEQADYIQAIPAPTSSVAINPCGRLTSDPALPSNAADNDAIATLYYAPHNGNVVMLRNSGETLWISRTFSSAISITITGLAIARAYDVFIYWNNSAIVAETVAWNTGDLVASNSNGSLSTSNPTRYATSRATALVLTDGRFTKYGEVHKLYVGSFHTNNNASGRTSDTIERRLVTNHYNRQMKRVKSAPSASTNVAGWYTTIPNQETMVPLYSVWIMSGVDTEITISSSNSYPFDQFGLFWLCTHLALAQAAAVDDTKFINYTANLANIANMGYGGTQSYQNSAASASLCTPLFGTTLSTGLKGFQVGVYPGYQYPYSNVLTVWGTIISGHVWN